MVTISDPNIQILNSSFEDSTNNSSASLGWTLFPTFNLEGNSVISISTGAGYTNVTPPDGIGYVVLQGTGSTMQAMRGFTIGQAYTMSIWALQRNATSQQFSVFIGTYTLSSSIVAPSFTTWSQYLLPFTASATTLPITFSGLNIGGGDRSICLDLVQFINNTNTIPITKTTKSVPAYTIMLNKRGLIASSSIMREMQGINLGGPSSIVGDDSIGFRNLQVGIGKNITDGNPNSPCLEIAQPGMWRFRWVVKPGQRRISVLCKQVKSATGQRPTMILKRNTAVGLNSDITVTAPAGSGWVNIGPYTFTATGTGVVYVELRNNLFMNECPLQESKALFDHIVVT